MKIKEASKITQDMLWEEVYGNPNFFSCEFKDGDWIFILQQHPKSKGEHRKISIQPVKKGSLVDEFTYQWKKEYALHFQNWLFKTVNEFVAEHSPGGARK